MTGPTTLGGCRHSGLRSGSPKASHGAFQDLGRAGRRARVWITRPLAPRTRSLEEILIQRFKFPVCTKPNLELTREMRGTRTRRGPESGTITITRNRRGGCRKEHAVGVCCRHSGDSSLATRRLGHPLDQESSYANEGHETSSASVFEHSAGGCRSRSNGAHDHPQLGTGPGRRCRS